MYDVVCIGNFTKDTIVTKTGSRVVPGGAFNYGAHAAKALGARTAAVTRLAREDADVIRELESFGVDVRVTYSPESTSLRLDYPTENPDDRTMTVTANAGPFAPREVEGLTSKSFILASSFHGEIGIDVIETLLGQNAMLALDVQGFIRRLADGHLFYSFWDERRRVLPLLSVLKTDAVEARYLTGESDFHAAARVLQNAGAREILLTHRDGVLVFDGKRSYEAPFLPGQIVGRSGRGDTCLAAYVARRLVSPPAEAIVWAAALTSKKLEVDGPFKGDYAAVERFVAESYHRIPS